MLGDIQSEAWAQIRDLQVRQAETKARQDFAFEQLREYMEKLEDLEEKRASDSQHCREMLQEILVAQKTYGQLMTRILPFAAIILTAVVSWVMQQL